MRRLWLSGKVLGGVSAGSMCWHADGATDSFGPDGFHEEPLTPRRLPD